MHNLAKGIRGKIQCDCHEENVTSDNLEGVLKRQIEPKVNWDEFDKISIELNRFAIAAL
jgi:hypothetical protein